MSEGGEGGGGGRLTEQETGHYRILQFGETIQTGDEWWSDYSQAWVPSTMQDSKVGAVAGNTCQGIANTYRRRIELNTEPEPSDYENHLLRQRVQQLQDETNRLRALNSDLKIELENLRISAPPPPAPASEIDSRRIHTEHIQQRVRDLLGYIRCQAFVLNFDYRQHVTETILDDILSELAKTE